MSFSFLKTQLFNQGVDWFNGESSFKLSGLEQNLAKRKNVSSEAKRNVNWKFDERYKI